MSQLATLFSLKDSDVIAGYLRSEHAKLNEVQLDIHGSDINYILSLSLNGRFSIKADCDFMRQMSEISLYSSEGKIKFDIKINHYDIKANTSVATQMKNLSVLQQVNSEIAAFAGELLDSTVFVEGLNQRQKRFQGSALSCEQVKSIEIAKAEFKEKYAFISTGTLRRTMNALRIKSKLTDENVKENFSVVDDNFTIKKFTVYYNNGQIHLSGFEDKISPFHQKSTLSDVMNTLSRSFKCKNDLAANQINHQLMKNISELAA